MREVVFEGDLRKPRRVLSLQKQSVRALLASERAYVARSEFAYTEKGLFIRDVSAMVQTHAHLLVMNERPAYARLS